MPETSELPQDGPESFKFPSNEMPGFDDNRLGKDVKEIPGDGVENFLSGLQKDLDKARRGTNNEEVGPSETTESVN